MVKRQFCLWLALLSSFVHVASGEVLTRATLGKPDRGPFASPFFTVNAGADQVISSFDTTLTGSVSGATFHVVRWTLTSGPPTVTIDRPNKISTAVHFTENGIYTFTLRVSSGFSFQTDTVIVQVTGGVQHFPPTISSVADVNTLEDTVAGPIAITVGDTETAAGSLVLTVTTSNPDVLPLSGIVLGGSGANRTITMTPVSNASGASVLTLTVTDGDNATATTSFTVRFTGVNDTPTMSAIADQDVDENVDLTVTFTIADVESSPANLIVTASSSNTAIYASKALGSWQFTKSGSTVSMLLHPRANAYGIVTLTVRVSDGLAAVTTNFTVTVHHINQSPAIVMVPPLATYTAPTAAPHSFDFTVSDIEDPPGALTVTKTSSVTSVVPSANVVLGSYGGSDSVRFVTVTPIAPGTSIITLTVHDTESGSESVSFSYTYSPTNTVPTLVLPGNVTVNKQMGLRLTNSFTVNDLETNPSALGITVISTNQALIPDSAITMTGTNTSRTLVLTPAFNVTGTTLITVTVTDSGGLVTTGTYRITVDFVNEAPSISAIPAQATPYVTAKTVNFTISDPESASADLTLTKASSDTALLPLANISYGGTGGSRSITMTPTASHAGTVLVTVGVSDGTNTTTTAFVLTVAAGNSAPTITSVANQTIVEDNNTGALSFTVGDLETSAGSLNMSGDSGDHTLVPLSGIVFGGSGANRTVTVTPAANGNGATTITLAVSDGTTNAVTSFTLTVTAFNDPPTITQLPAATTAYGTPIAFNVTVNDVETAAASLSVVGTSDNTGLVPNANIVMTGSGASRVATITPVAGQSGVANITLTVSDGVKTGTTIFALTVSSGNAAPTISNFAPQSGTEDTTTSAFAFTIGDLETAAGSLTLAGVSSDQTIVANTGIVFGGSGASRTVTITPVANANGPVTIQVSVSDGVNVTIAGLVLTLAPVNDPPTITQLPSQTTAYNTAIAIPITVGDVETAVGSLTVTGVSGNTTLVPNANIVITGTTASRVATITPVTSQSGSAAITLTVSDGTNSTPTTFTLVVLSGNVAPSISPIQAKAGFEDITLAPIAFTVSDPETAAGSLTVTAVSSDQNLMPSAGMVLGGSGANRTITLSSAHNQFGTCIVTLNVTDGTATTSTSFSVTINSVNDIPTVSAIANQTISQNGSVSVNFTVDDVETPVGSLSVFASSSSQLILRDGGIVLTGSGANRTATLTPQINMSGSVVVTISASDGQDTGTSVFTLTIVAANQAPTISSVGNQTVLEDSSVAVSFVISDFETTATSLTVSAASSDPSIIPNAGLVFTGSGSVRTLTISPAANASGGPVSVTATVSDGLLSANSIFSVTVTATNDAPVVSMVAPLSTPEDTPVTVTFTLSDVETAAGSLTVSGTSSVLGVVANSGLVFGGSGANRTLTLTPVLNASGATTITISASDGTNTTSTTFGLTVTPQNDRPTISAISGKSTLEDTASASIPVLLGDVETAPGLLSLSAVSSDQTVVLNSGITLGGSGANRTVVVNPVLNASGVTTITLTVSDGLDSDTSSFLMTVTAVNDPPTITAIPAQSTAANTLKVVSFTVSDVETSAGSLAMSGTSSSQTLVPDANIVFGGSGANRTANVTPATGQSGTCTLTFTVTDGTTPVSTSFTFTVAAGNQAPTISSFAVQSIPEDGTDGPLAFTVGDAETAAASLTVSGVSSNPFLVASSGIVFGGSGANRTVTISPLPDQFGTATITVTVSDGAASTSSTISLTVTTVNDHPTISSIANQAIVEDDVTLALGFTVNDVETAATSLTVTGVSGNTALVPNNPANITFGGSGANRTVIITPAANQSGVATITLSVNDGTDTTDTSFIVTVSAVNDPPTLTGIANQIIAEDDNTGALSFTVGDVETAPTSLVVTTDSSNRILVPLANVVVAGSGAAKTVTVTPVANLSGVSTISLTVSDGSATTNITFTVTVNAVNDRPTISAIGNQTISEHGNTGPLTFNVNDVETAAISLTVTGVSSDTVLVPNNVANITFGGSGANRSVTITPVNGLSGSTTITLTVSDGSLTQTSVFNVTVIPVNDPPTISAISTPPISEDGNTGNLAFTISDPESTAASLTLSGASSSQSVVALSGIAFGGSAGNRTVSVTPVANAFGSSIITVSVSDGTNTVSTSFTVVVNSVNDIPTITSIPNQVINQASATPALSFSIFDVETALTSLTTVATSDNTLLVPNNVANLTITGTGGTRTIVVTPVTTQSGTARITVTVGDGTTTTPTTFTVTVTAVNQPPTITAISTPPINEDGNTGALSFTVGDLETAAGSLTVSGNSSLQTLVPNANIVFGGSGASRTVTVTPLANQFGTCTITVSVSDGSASTTTSFTLVVNSVNDIPTITSIASQPTPEDQPLTVSFTVNDVETPAANLTVVATSGNTTLVPTANIVLGGSGSSRTATITPALNLSGTALITLTVGDGTTTTPTSFTLTVTAVDDPPTITAISTPPINEDGATAALAFTVNDVETAPGSLTLTGNSSLQTLVPNANIVFGGSGANRTVTVTPLANQFGTCTITVTVSDGANPVSTSFTLVVNSVNDHPTISTPSPVSIVGNTSAVVPFTVGDVETAAASLTVSGVSLNTLLVPNANIVFGGSGANRTVTVTPITGQSGTASITLTVSDGVDTTSVTFVLTVTPGNTAPTITTITAKTVAENGTTGAIAFTVGDAESLPAALTVTATSSSLTVIPASGIVLGGTTAARTITITPALNQYTTVTPVTITLTVSDGTNSTPTTFTVAVTFVNQTPTITAIPNQTIQQNGTATVSFTVGDVEVAAGSLTVTRVTGNAVLLPLTGLVLGGSGAARTLAITPAAGQSGTGTVTVSVTDATNTANASFTVTVPAGANTPPTISTISATTIATTGGTVSFTVSDTETPQASLVVTATSASPLFNYSGGLVLGTSGGGTFSKWQQDGVDFSTLPNITVSASADHLMNAVYGTTTGRTLGVIATTSSGSAITVSLTDTLGAKNGTTPFARLYANAASVTLTAPAAGFTKWQQDGVDLTTAAAATVTMNANHLLNAVYGSTTGFITTVSGGTSRNNAAQDLGMRIQVGAAPLTVTQLGRYCIAGNSQTHLMRIVDVATLTDVVGGSATVNMSGGTANTFVYASLASSVTLAANTAYYILSRETSGGDMWKDSDVTVATSSAASLVSWAYLDAVWGYLDGTAPTHPFIPVDFKYSTTAGGTTVHSIVVASSNPDSGQAITASPADLNAAGNGSTPFARVYNTGQAVTLGAPGGSVRTLTITPLNGQSGSGSITVTVTDGGGLTASTTFTCTVQANNTAPVITAMPATFSLNEGQVLGFTFGVADDFTSAASLTVSTITSNPALLPTSSVAVTGGATRTVTLSPVAHQCGTATLTFTVSDGSLTTSSSVAVTVTCINDPPTITGLTSQSITLGAGSSSQTATVFDYETALASLTLSGTSGNTTLVPNANITFSGTTGSRTVTVTPAAGQTGTATITITVSDGALSGQQSFQFAVNATGTRNFYVGPNGSSGNTGLSTSSPWDIDSVKDPSGHGLKGGDTVWIMPGLYRGRFVFSGNYSSPIIFRGLNRPWGAAANTAVFDRYTGLNPSAGTTGDGTLDFATGANNIWFWDLSFINTCPRTSFPNPNTDRGNAFYIDQRGNNKIINCVIKDSGNGIGVEDHVSIPAGNFEIYGNITAYNGNTGDDDMHHGHGFYMQAKHPTDTMTIKECVSHSNFGQGWQSRGGGSDIFLYNYTLEGNVFFNNGYPGYPGGRTRNVLFGGGEHNNNYNLRSNFTYYAVADDGGPSWYMSYPSTDPNSVGNPFTLNKTLSFQGNVIWGGDFLIGRWTNGVVTGNIFVGTAGRPAFWWYDEFGKLSCTFNNNQIYGDSTPYKIDTVGEVSLATWRSQTGFGANDTASTGTPGQMVFLRPNFYDAKMANLIIYNPSGASTVAVSMAGFLNAGDTYDIYSTTSWTSRFATGTYNGSTISVSMNNFPMMPIVGTIANPQPLSPLSPEPLFGCFRIIKTN
jgi:hypothetical protein